MPAGNDYRDSTNKFALDQLRCELNNKDGQKYVSLQALAGEALLQQLPSCQMRSHSCCMLVGKILML